MCKGVADKGEGEGVKWTTAGSTWYNSYSCPLDVINCLNGQQ